METEQLTKEQLSDLAQKFGGRWCTCIYKIISKLTTAKLAAYCIKKGYKPWKHGLERDESGVRYSYYLQTIEQIKTLPDATTEQKELNVVASFGEFSYRPFDSLESILEAISKIGWFEKRSSQDVAVDVIAMDEKSVKIPDPKDTQGPIRQDIPAVQRYAQTQQGTFPIN